MVVYLYLQVRILILNNICGMASVNYLTNACKFQQIRMRQIGKN